MTTGAGVSGSGITALEGANDAVTQRMQQAVAAGLNVMRMFASETDAGEALESSPGALLLVWVVELPVIFS